MGNELKENITTIVENIGEPIIESFLNDGLLKGMPILGTGMSIVKLSSNISDMILLKKINIFMHNLNIVNKNDVDKFTKKMNNDKYRNDVGIKLMNIIDKSDEYIKIKWTAELFLDYLDKKIEKDSFFRIISIINNSLVQDIVKLKVFKNKDVILSNNKLIETFILHQLFVNGLLENYGLDGGVFTETNDEGDSGTIYALNKFGEYILNRLL